ncbi:NYN domain-containing protein [Pseudoalteromonas sp. OOF1S-7]|uniref:LabA-like NYN domain-containing protein n=1 Tax=Pseudoalteromonas sp. OOF1S-7 TaxID=2917757 RepID=UPI001EF69526|nr:NYN domain-containing protein [Pseudoalteromonas sp. OOF1S-7]MCG7534525.1 NYN domain-containing protein [Pseudoalteromonas sp. OOF1S-7]
MKSIAILVDVQNIYYTTRQAYGRSFDYNGFWQEVLKGRTLYRALAYSSEPNAPKQQQFQNILRAIGFEVKQKPYIQRTDGSAKCDWDVGITLDAMECAPHCDVVVLLTGDGDFDLLAERIQSRHNCEVEVYGVPQLTANSLKRAATRYVAIDERLLLNAKPNHNNAGQ